MFVIWEDYNVIRIEDFGSFEYFVIDVISYLVASQVLDDARELCPPSRGHRQILQRGDEPGFKR